MTEPIIRACACRGRHEAHRPSVITAESWSLYAGQHRAICGSCNWRGPWRADDAKAADRDALDHQFEKDCQTTHNAKGYSFIEEEPRD